ncbi:DNA polymerase-3 subunit gamma/tau [Anaeroplasma bactoclasticum]|uniref:DNA polymerase III subunit gamma/tau n=1 Tax=Anaeroplasma bactoclasticum TaxID=2088 RepID=A0A397RT08_9MOLU|nr:DNA polymerase III subunit gamma/tau [Anaeroplasma bactoclasticum]RIA75549.1 DNA polymerase-3 subunit gamma/tau [Anaeroplasma bactoclasticum]
MAYVALYRAYRPQKFLDVVGQEHIIKTLQNAIKLNKVAHAYLFCGPRGTGKTTLAKIMAKAMNCEKGPTVEPCCECDICQGITKGTISDVVEIDAASNNGADDIRALRSTVKFLPSQGKYKVYIIDEVHMLSDAAFNALLKTLEEPPAHVIFILATTEPYKLPNTILSRCQRFDFQSISIDDILKRLKIVANEENVKITEEALHQIAISAEGGMRDALSLFDQCISFSQNPEITLDDVLSVSGNISYVKIIELLNACISKDETKAISLLDNIIKEGKEVPRIINDVILFLRDLLLYKNNAVLEEKLMFKNPEFMDLARNVEKSVVYHWLDILNDVSNQMRFSTQKRAYIELAVLKMNDNEQNDIASFKSRLESLEQTIQMMSQNGFQMKANAPEKRVVNVANIPSREEMMAYRNQKQNVVNTTNDDVTNDQNDVNIVVSTTKIEEKPVVVTTNNVVNTTNNGGPEQVTIKDVENIINNASKAKRDALLKVWPLISSKYDGVGIQILVHGNLQAVSEDSFIVELSDVSFCNRAMQYENFVKIIEILNEYGLNIKDYICLPTSVWRRIIADYKSKYSKDNPKPVLEDFPLGVVKRAAPKAKIQNSESNLVNQVLEFFDDNELKIVEE